MYEVKIKESSPDLTARDRIKIRDTGSMVSFETIEDNKIIAPSAWAALEVVTDRKTYDLYCIICDDGMTYKTGSSNFWDSFRTIFTSLEEAGELDSPWAIRIMRKESRNFPGKHFYVAALA